MTHNAYLFRLPAGLLVFGGLWLAYTQQQQPLTVEKLADDLHIIVGSGGNVAVLTTDEGVVLVDTKFERNVPEILEKVRGLTDKPVRYILNTHHHGDHTGGNAKLGVGAQIVAQENAWANMNRGKMPGPPGITFGRTATLRVGGKEIRMHHFGRGHTDGDAFILFTAHRIVHTGDMFVASGPFIDHNNGGSGIEWSDTINKVLQLDFERVIPGHGPMMVKSDLRAWNEAFGTVRMRMSELKRKGISKEEAAKTLKLDDLTLWKNTTPWRSAADYSMKSSEVWSTDAELFAMARRELFVSVVGDVMDKMKLRRQFLPARVQPLAREMVTIGRAMPVLVADRACDIDDAPAPFGLMMEALDSLKPGEIYLCTGGSPEYAYWGELMSTRAMVCGAVGAVLDGYTRDLRGILDLQFPVFCYGSYGQDQGPRGRVVDYRVPVQIGQVSIGAGDIVFGDCDGVCVVPRKAEQDVFAAALEKARGEKTVRKEIEGGMPAKEAFEKYGIL